MLYIVYDGIFPIPLESNRTREEIVNIHETDQLILNKLYFSGDAEMYVHAK